MSRKSFWNNRNIEIALAILNGETQSTVASRLGVTSSRVRQIAIGIFMLAGNKANIAIDAIADAKEHKETILPILMNTIANHDSVTTDTH